MIEPSQGHAGQSPTQDCPVYHSPASRPLISDELAIRGVVTAIRNSLVPPGERQPSSPMPGARSGSRLSLHAPVSLMAAAIGDGRVAILDESPISAEARDISLGGIGLVHSTPLPGRYAAVLCSTVAPIGLVVEVTHSCPDVEGCWQSGARILGLISSTANDPPVPRAVRQE